MCPWYSCLSTGMTMCPWYSCLSTGVTMCPWYSCLPTGSPVHQGREDWRLASASFCYCCNDPSLLLNGATQLLQVGSSLHD